MQQGELFSAQEQWRLRSPTGTYGRSATLELTAAALEQWKMPIRTYQQEQRQGAQQPHLFDWAGMAPPSTPSELDPWSLPPQNSLFWRHNGQQTKMGGDRAAFYFVIDYGYPLLLYVGETGRGQRRWQQEHDCKQYVQQYLFAHRRVQLAVDLGIAFDYGAPSNRKQRQQQERQLIAYWKSPFNKENWSYWQTPFVRD